MKKLLLIAVIALLGLNVNAQEGKFNAGVNLGLPTGDLSKVSSFALSAEVNYMFTVAEGFTAGPSVQYTYFVGKDFGGTKTNASYLPLAAAGRYNVSEMFVVGADLGYAVALSPSGADGGFYYRPMVGYKLGDNMQLNLAYSGISQKSTSNSISYVSLGVMFGL
tara:strand:- start:2098 stop:2589 length:492 start_codon:yes stop_codon:yes gene_type:complete